MRERLMQDLRVAQRQIDVDGVRTCLFEAGDGPPLILLHGAVPVGGVIWCRVVSGLAATQRVIVPDVPGFGESPPVPTLDGDVVARWIGGLIRETCDAPPTLVAHSMLGSLAATFATRGRVPLRQLIISGAPGLGRYRMPLRLRAAAIRLTLAPSVDSLERFLPWPFLSPEATRSRDPEWFDAFTSYLVNRGSLAHVKKAVRQTVNAGARRIPDSLLSRIDVPTALLWGRDDRMAPLGLAREAASRHGWRLHVVDDCGHVPYIERPDAAIGALQHLILTPTLREGDTDVHQ